MEESKTSDAGGQMQPDNKKQKSSSGIRQIVLLLLLFLMVGLFLFDKYKLTPDAEAKIDKVMEEVSLKISENNRTEIEEIVGFKPSSVFEHKGLQVAQYKFPRAIPFILPASKRLDVAYRGDAIAMMRDTKPYITKEALDAQFPGEITIDRTKNTRGEITPHVSPTGN